MREVVGIFGGTGCGKSTLLSDLLRPHTHAVAIDPWAEKSNWPKRGFTQVRDVDKLSDLLSKNWRRGFRYVVTPPPDRAAQCLNVVSNLLFGYSRMHRLARVVLAVDEMAACYSNAHAKTADLPGFPLVLLQGRHFNISIYGVTQFPTDVAAQFRGMCNTRYIFALYDAQPRQTILETIGRDKAGLLPNADYEYLRWERGKITRGRTHR